MEDLSREALVAEFRAFLQESETLAQNESEDGAGDLYQLYLALTGLKNEVRIESRQFKEALDRFRTLFEVVEEGRSAQLQELDRRRELWESQAQKSMGGLLLELLSLRDRLEQGAVMIESHKPSFFPRLSDKETAWRRGVAEGQRMLLRRLEQILFGQGVSPLETLDRPLDPHTMRAVTVENRDDKPQGVVVAETLKGYVWDGRLLRAAEVCINKREEDHS